MPFSSGTRTCIGQYFAQVEAVTAISMLVKEYSFSVPLGVTKDELLHSDLSVGLKPTNGVNLIVKKR